MRILAIDPGTTESGFVLWDGERAVEKGVNDNQDILTIIAVAPYDLLAIEMIASYGMPVGKETFQTCLWIGRYIQAHGDDDAYTLCYRKDIKMHLCGSMRAKDAHIWQALVDRFGAPGKKGNQGVLYGVKSHERAALAVAVYAFDQAVGAKC